LSNSTKEKLGIPSIQPKKYAKFVKIKMIFSADKTKAEVILNAYEANFLAA